MSAPLTARRPLLAALVLALAGCPSPPPPADGGDAMPDAPAVSPAMTARFNVEPGDEPPAPFEIPFPSDIYLTADGTLRDDLSDFSAVRVIRATETFTLGFRHLDGFGRNTGAMFVIDSTHASGSPPFVVDPASLPADAEASLARDATAFLVDLDPSAAPATARVPAVAGWQPQFRTITIQPDRAVLAPGRRYAAVLTTGVRATAAPTVLRAAPSFAAIRDDAPGARAGALGQLYGAAVDRVVELSGPGFDRSRIAALAVFTTQTTHRQLRAIRDAVVADRFGPAPALDTDPDAVRPYSAVRFGATAHAGWTATLTEWLGTPPSREGRHLPGFPDRTDPMGTGLAHDAIGAVITGAFTSPDFRTMVGTFGTGMVPDPANPAQRLAVTLALPRGPVPAQGFPVVIFGHGLGGQRREMMSIANEMARAGFATAAIDHPTFGQRAVPMESMSLERGSYRGPDGFGDSPNYPATEFFGNLTNVLAFRDNIRQAVLDLVQLRRLLANPALDLSRAADAYGGTAPRLDGRHVGYVGNSLGGIIGTVFAATEPEVNPVVLNVAGGGLITALAANSPAQSELVGRIAGLIFGAPTDAVFDRFHPVANLLQMIVDGADPAAYGPEVTRPAAGRPHDVWLVESLYDEVLSNAATRLLAYSMGLPQIQPVLVPLPGLASAPASMAMPLAGNLAMGATGGYLQSAPSTHGANLNQRRGNHEYEPPFPRPTAPRFVRLARPYTVREPIVAYQRNIAEFLRSGFAGEARITITGMEPIFDVDDDGWTDEEERSMGADPYDPMSHPAGAPPHPRDVGF